MASERVGGILDSGPVHLGDQAPDFELPALIGGVRKSFRLSDCRGKQVILAFYPFNWQDASLRQMSGYQAHRDRLLRSATETVALSVESIMNTTAWERHKGPFDFPLCSDFWPHGGVAGRYGVLRESGAGAGAAERAIFILDRDLRVALRKIYAWDQIPPFNDVLRELDKAS